MKKKYIIFGKGYANTTVSDPFISNKEISDIQYGYGRIKLTTTEKELEKFLDIIFASPEDLINAEVFFK